jgi:sulfide:quinone oxidoreductase
MARVIILGGGFGGIAAATRLRDLLPRSDEVVLVDRRRDFAMGLRKTWAVVGSHPLEDGVRPLSRLADRGIEVIEAVIDTIDPTTRTVRLDDRSLEADALVVALGVEQVPEQVPGLVEHGINVWDRAEAGRAHAALEGLSGGRLAIGVFGLPYACPPGPFELALLANERLAVRGIPASVEVFGPMPIALPVVGPTESAKIEALLEAAGVAFLRGRRGVEVRDGAVRFEDGEERPFDLLFAVPPHRCPEVLVRAGLAAPGGWVAVDPRTLATPFAGVYAVGDCTAIMLAHGLPLPKAGVFAEAEGYVAAERIAAEIVGTPSDAAFAGEGVCYAEVGGRQAAEVRGRFLADPPEIAVLEPSVGAVQAKVAFEAERLASWFGH